MITTIQLRRGTAAQWTSDNPVLQDGELGIETDTAKAKLGDGSTAWTSLGYWDPDGATIGSFLPLAGGTMSGPVAMGAHQINQLANGAVSTDAATVGQVTSAQTAAESYADSAVATETTRAETAEALALLKGQNLADLVSPATARTNLSLGTAATQNTSAFDAAGSAASAQTAAEAFATSAVGTETTRAEAAEAQLAPLAGASFTGNVSTTGTLSSSESVTAGVVTITYAATITPNAAAGNHFRCTLTGNVTLNAPTGGLDGQKITVELIQDVTGGRTLTLGTGFGLGTDITAVTLTTTASKRDYLALIYNATSGNWDVVGVVRGY